MPARCPAKGDYRGFSVQTTLLGRAQLPEMAKRENNESNKNNTGLIDLLILQLQA